MAKGLTTKTIMQAGFEVLAETGLDGLTMRAIADCLGIKAAAIYWHFQSKQDLLDEMATQLWREIMAAVEAMPRSSSAAERVVLFAQAVRSVVLRYRDGARLFAGTFLSDDSLLRQQEEGLREMVAQGYTVKTAVQVYTLVYSFTVGFVIEEQAMAQSRAAGEERYTIPARNARLEAEKHNLAVEASKEVFGPADERFSELLAILAQTVEAMRTAC